MTKVSMMQPSFLPWQGLFELILNSDKFIFLDDFQYVVQSHHTRNRLFVNKNQVDFYNVPIQKAKCFEAKLNEVLIVENNVWKNKILKRLQNIYGKTDYFKEIYPLIENWLTKDFKILSDLNIEGIKLFSNILNIKTDFLYSSVFSNETKSDSIRSQRVEELLEWSNATQYLSAYGSYNYMIQDNFDFSKYNVLFQNFIPKSYHQIQSEEFVPYLSILDALFNVGATQTFELVKSGTTKWLNPEERGNQNDK